MTDWVVDHDLMQWDEPEMQIFNECLGRALQEMTSATVADFPPEMDIIVTGWANISRNGAYTRAHSHDGSLWSAIYYVAAEQAPAEPAKKMTAWEKMMAKREETRGARCPRGRRGLA